MIRRDVIPPSQPSPHLRPTLISLSNHQARSQVENGRSSSVVIRTELVQVQQLTYSEQTRDKLQSSTSKLHLLQKSTLCQYSIHTYLIARVGAVI